jgi:hypothetical protein
MSADTGTRHLADGIAGYRLVRREDVELVTALPGPLERAGHVSAR